MIEWAIETAIIMKTLPNCPVYSLAQDPVCNVFDQIIISRGNEPCPEGDLAKPLETVSRLDVSRKTARLK